MEILEAYQRVLDAAEDLRKGGIEVEVKASESESNGEDDALPREKWVNIVFRPKDKEEADTIRRKADQLGWAGIAFDMGGSSGLRCWEIDWSLRVSPTPDGEWEAAGHEVENMIDDMEKPKDN